MTMIYLDESGFTGDDLLHDQQPHFVLASSLVGDEEAEAIMRRCFPRFQGPEFKFKVLWRRREVHRDGLRALAAELPAVADRAFLFVVDKRFALLGKMFDYLAEPVFRATGRDFYRDGYAMRYMNTVHRDVLRAGGADVYEGATARWNAFARAPSTTNFKALQNYLGEIVQTSVHPISTIFGMLSKGASFFEASNSDLSDFTDSNEIQVTSILSSITHWRQRESEDFDIVHDESTSFDSQQELWSTITRDDFTSPPFRQANGTIVELPLRVRSTTGVRSETSSAIQFADLLAGLGAKFALTSDSDERDPFLIDLVKRGAGALTSGGVRPHDDYAVGGVPLRVGPDPLDTMTDLLAPYFDGDRSGD